MPVNIKSDRQGKPMNDISSSTVLRHACCFKTSFPALAACTFLLLPMAVHAAGPTGPGDDYVIYSPKITQGETEVELRGFNTRDANAAIDRTGVFGVALAYSPTAWWKTEIYSGPYNYAPAVGTHLGGVEWENFFNVGSQEEYGADLGFMANYARYNASIYSNAVEVGPMVQRETESTQQRLNLIWQKTVGVDLVGKFDFRATYTAGYKVNDEFVPGLEAYYRPADNSNQLGPGFSGEYHLGHIQTLEYSTALLYGLNNGAPAHTFVFRVSSVF